MRILVLSLLRLGDTIMLAPVLNGLANARKDAQIDVLSFKPVGSLHALFPVVRRWWTLNRDELQAGLGQADIPLLTSYAVLDEQLRDIDTQKYDLIINLTQTNFSAYVAGALKSVDRLGLTFDMKGAAHFYSPWFRYLNETTSGHEQSDIFHHTDIFMHACGLGAQEKDWSLSTPASGKDEVEALGLTGSKKIVLQMLTSDAKKNWGEPQWLNLVRRLHNEGQDIIALGAPNEETQIRDFAALSAAYGVTVKPAILSMGGALALLHSADLLITGDTSIKHLANATKIKVLELSLGSSDWRRTGTYTADSLIMQGRVPCAPCPHSSPCSQKSHLCATALNADMVAQAAAQLLTDNWSALAELSRQHPTIKWLRTHHLKTGFWFASDLNETGVDQVVDALLERCARKLALNQGRDQDFIEFGSEGLNLRRELHTLFANEVRDPIFKSLDFLETKESMKVTAAATELDAMRAELKGGLGEIAAFRQRQIALETARKHSEFKTKLIRTLKSNWTETI